MQRKKRFEKIRKIAGKLVPRILKRRTVVTPSKPLRVLFVCNAGVSSSKSLSAFEKLAEASGRKKFFSTKCTGIYLPEFRELKGRETFDVIADFSRPSAEMNSFLGSDAFVFSGAKAMNMAQEKNYATPEYWNFISRQFIAELGKKFRFKDD